MVQAQIEDLLRKKIGLAPSSIGSNRIFRAIEGRRIACQIGNLESYWQKLQVSPREIQYLIESVTIPETCFFRDRKPFEFIGKYVREEWLPKNCNNTLNLLSIPCSTGEEPYSLAMTLAEVRFNFNKFKIDAIDINKEALAKAKKGFYTNNSFRQKPFDYQNKYFKQIENGYQLIDKIKEKVYFQYGNILDNIFLINNKYDLILCRNLLIYLDNSARKKALEILDNLLKPQGLLFVGSGETGIIPTKNFISICQPFTFAYQKKMPMFNFTIDRKLEEKVTNYEILFSSSSEKIIENKEKLEHSVSSVTNLETARKLANYGKLEEAARLCQDYLRNNVTSAEAYVLLGEINQEWGKNEQAEIYYQKAVYLKPNYYEALVHLALLKENTGNLTEANSIRQRIERIVKAKQ